MRYFIPARSKADWLKGKTEEVELTVTYCSNCKHHRAYHTDEHNKPIPCFEVPGCDCKEYVPTHERAVD